MTEKKQKSAWKKFLQSLTKAHDLGKEEEIMIADHEYDGIKELDNVLPPWWKYGFYITILVGVFYYIQVFTNQEQYSQEQEYLAEVEKGKAEVEAYKAANPELFKLDVTLLTDSENLAAGKKVFGTYCVACHMADGGGGIGPNLTDDKWILGGGMENVLNTLNNGGRPGKGMISWKTTLNNTEMQQVASYVISLNGTTPANPKAAEGDITWSKQ
jgi:cytochrome c oxidase cbb3-type subunit 3